MTTTRSTPAGRRPNMRGRRLRRALAGVVVGALVPLALASFAPLAAAAPAVTFKATAVPIPGFPGTGNILGAGADVQTEATIAGTEYGGFPSPLVLLTIASPAGTRVDSDGFATCTQAVLEADGPQGCPRQSSAGPVGEGLGIVSFGHEQVREKVSIQGFFAPRQHPAVLRRRHHPNVARNHRKSPLGQRQPPVRAGGSRRTAAHRNGARCARRIGPVLQSHDRRGPQAGQEDDLLHHPPQKMPASWPPDQGRIQVRQRRKRHRHIQAALPQEVDHGASRLRSRGLLSRPLDSG